MAPPPITLWQRDLGSDAANVKTTFSSWDGCMAESYCKWPAIVGIVIGSLIVISIIFCCARCLCCGLECCCACCSCFNRCCPSPRNRRNDGYQQPGPGPMYGQYQSPAPPAYGGYGAGAGPGAAGGMYRAGSGGVPQTATFDGPTKTSRKGAGSGYNEDALPAMPSWDQATSHHVEEEETVEMSKLDHQNAQQQGLLAGQGINSNDRYYGHTVGQETNGNGDLGTMQTGPYHDYSSHQQFASSPTSTTAGGGYPPTYRTRPESSVYDPQGGTNGYAPSIPPSYRTAAPSIISPLPQQVQVGQPVSVGRKPVQGSWRDV